MQESILRFFSEIASQPLDVLVELITMLGEQYFFIMIIAYLYWNVSKKSGFTMASVFLFSAVVNNGLKILVRAPRPFETLDFIAGKRVETATGYSFPSGHTQGAATFFTTAAVLIRRRAFTVLAALIMIAVAVSRIYLGVHWPLDTAAGLLLGVLLGWAGCRLVERLWERQALLKRVYLGVTLFLLLVMAGLLLLQTPGAGKMVKIADFFKVSGTFIGAVGGFLLQERRFPFGVSQDAGRKAVRYALGLIGTVLLMQGLKALFPVHPLSDAVRYAAVGGWLTSFFPWIGLKTGLFQRADA